MPLAAAGLGGEAAAQGYLMMAGIGSRPGPKAKPVKQKAPVAEEISDDEQQASGPPQTWMDRAVEYKEKVKKKAGEARWFSISLKDHSFQEVPKQMGELAEWLESAFNMLHVKIQNGENTEACYQALFTIIEGKFKWYDANAKTAKSMEKGVTPAKKKQKKT